jgi:predicted nucleotidyltransferase
VPFDIQKAKKHFESREEKKRRELELMRTKALEELNRIVQMLIRKYNPRRIYSWGYVHKPGSFSRVSDIDIAVESLAGPLEGLHAQGDAEELTGFPVDLVELERIHPLHAETIRTRGKLLYERE